MKYYILILFNFYVCFSLLAQSLDDNLLLHYKFDNNFLDESSNNYDGVNFGAVFGLDRFGNQNSAAYFDGIDDYINFPNITDLKPSLPVSFSFYIKYDNTNYEDSTVFNTSFEEDVNSGIYMNIQSSTGKYQISFGDGSNSYSPFTRRTYTSNNVIDNSQWHHIAIVVTSNFDMKIYLDCIELGGLYSGSGGSLQYSNLSGAIGRHDRDLNAPADYFKGAVDDFMYWDRQLTQSEIELLCARLSDEEFFREDNIISIYPNPSSGQFNIYSAYKFDKLYVYDSSGRLVIEEGYSKNLDLSNCSKGIYFVKLLDKSKVTTKRIVKN